MFDTAQAGRELFPSRREKILIATSASGGQTAFDAGIAWTTGHGHNAWQECRLL